MKFESDTQLSKEDVSFKSDWYRWKNQRQSERIKSEVYKYNGIWVILKKKQYTCSLFFIQRAIGL